MHGGREVCAICMDVPEDGVCTACNHIFCRQCLARWLHRSQSCPTCRRPQSRAPLFQLTKASPPFNPTLMLHTVAVAVTLFVFFAADAADSPRPWLVALGDGIAVSVVFRRVWFFFLSCHRQAMEILEEFQDRQSLAAT